MVPERYISIPAINGECYILNELGVSTYEQCDNVVVVLLDGYNVSMDAAS